MCGHAYALTRFGARKMLSHYDLCHAGAMDGQWHTIARQHGLTWQKASPESYRDLKPGFEDNPHYFTRGIFNLYNEMVWYLLIIMISKIMLTNKVW